MKDTNKKEHTDMGNHMKKDTSTYGNCLSWNGCVEKSRAISKNMHKRIAPWCALVYYKLQEIYQRCKALWKSKMPSVKVQWITSIYEPKSLQKIKAVKNPVCHMRTVPSPSKRGLKEATAPTTPQNNRFNEQKTTATATRTSVENVTSRYFYYFAIIPIRSTCTMWA